MKIKPAQSGAICDLDSCGQQAVYAIDDCSVCAEHLDVASVAKAGKLTWELRRLTPSRLNERHLEVFGLALSIEAVRSLTEPVRTTHGTGPAMPEWFEEARRVMTASVEALHQGGPEGVLYAVPDEVSWRICRQAIIAAAELFDDRVLEAWSRVKADPTEENELRLEGEYKRVIDAADLEWAVQGLHNEFYGSEN